MSSGIAAIIGAAIGAIATATGVIVQAVLKTGPMPSNVEKLGRTTASGNDENWSSVISFNSRMR